MCKDPSFIWLQRGSGYEKQVVPCRKCGRCLANRVNDYVGRALCEAQTAMATVAVTLTYAPRDDLSERVLTPRHFQDFVRSLRRAGHSLRYLVAGEYGEGKGRAHFHALLFFYPAPGLAARGLPEVPDWPSNRRFWTDHWGEVMPDRSIRQLGHLFADVTGEERAIRYICKYLLKADPGNRWFSLSKKPALGAEWFAAKALEAFEADVFPSSFHYLPPGGERGRKYLMTGATRRDYLARVVELHATRRQLDRTRLNEWVEIALRKVELWQTLRDCSGDPEDDSESFAQHIEGKRPREIDVARMLFDLDPETPTHETSSFRKGFGKWLEDFTALDPERVKQETTYDHHAAVRLGLTSDAIRSMSLGRSEKPAKVSRTRSTKAKRVLTVGKLKTSVPDVGRYSRP